MKARRKVGDVVDFCGDPALVMEVNGDFMLAYDPTFYPLATLPTSQPLYTKEIPKETRVKFVAAKLAGKVKLRR